MGVLIHSIFSFVLSLSTLAEAEPWREDYGSGGTEVLPLGDHDYDWLYQILFPAELRQDLPNESFKSFRVHLRDTDDYFPDPSMIQKNQLREISRVRGKITYVGIFPKSYRYDVLTSENHNKTLFVKVHLKNATAQDLRDFAQKIAAAQDLWNSSRVSFDFPYRFRFELSEESQAHYSVEVLDKTRGPYDQYWGRNWNSFVVAHELGHMLGLGDEYKTLSGEIDCLKNSLMCASWSGELMPHHHYFILRRLVARPSSSEN